MARIIYAASGDGYGHAVRAHSVGAALLARGHDVQFVTCHKAEQYLREHYPGRLHPAFGLFTIYNEGKAEPLQTLIHNARRAVTGLIPANRAVMGLFQRFKPDLVITDFEPFCAFWARRFGIPFVSLDNQHLLTHCKLDHPPGHFRDVLNAYLTIRLYFAGARQYLITTFIKAPVRYQPAKLVDPILRPRVYEMHARDDGFLLAYKGAGGENEVMRRELERFDRMPIRAYGFGLEHQRGHVTYKPIDAEAFLNDLAACSAVITSAGHSLVCECLHFRKPMLLVPILQQYEQILNARSVERMGAGKRVDRLSVSAMEAFVDHLDPFRNVMASLPPARIESVLDAIECEIV